MYWKEHDQEVATQISAQPVLAHLPRVNQELLLQMGMLGWDFLPLVNRPNLAKPSKTFQELLGNPCWSWRRELTVWYVFKDPAYLISVIFFYTTTICKICTLESTWIWKKSCLASKQRKLPSRNSNHESCENYDMHVVENFTLGAKLLHNQRLWWLWQIWGV